MNILKSPQIEPRDLVTINLRYSSAAKPLKTLAFAQLAAKVLFLSSSPISVDEVAKRIAMILGVQKISTNFINAGLEFLLENNKVTNTARGEWALTDEARGEIKRDVDISASRLNRVLKRHFPSVEGKPLNQWFNEVSAKVFGIFGDDWISSVSRRKVEVSLKSPKLPELLKPHIEKYGLQKYSESLQIGYVKFLTSPEFEDQEHLMSLGQAMFSARLVAADVGADPITIDELRGAIILLDTNLLFAIALEDHKLAKSIEALSKALQKIGVRLHFIRPSVDEYHRVLDYKRTTIPRIMEIYQAEVVAGIVDDFIATAKNRLCKTKEDYERFFNSLDELPSEFYSGLPLQLIETREIAEAIEKAESDSELKQQIQYFWFQWRGRRKSNTALNHDASLILVTEKSRNLGDNCWVLSSDKPLHACAIGRTSPYGVPLVLSVEALIEVLAAHSTGPDLNASDFAPLLSRMLLQQCEPLLGTYQLDDLDWMADINEEVTQLPPEATIEIAKEVSRARLKGATKTDNNLQLMVNRMFQQKRKEEKQQVRDLLERAQSSEAQAIEEKKLRMATESELSDIKKMVARNKAKTRLLIALAWRTAVALVTSFLAWKYARHILPTGARTDLMNYLSAAIPIVLAAWRLIPNALKKYRDTVK